MIMGKYQGLFAGVFGQEMVLKNRKWYAHQNNRADLSLSGDVLWRVPRCVLGTVLGAELWTRCRGDITWPALLWLWVWYWINFRLSASSETFPFYSFLGLSWPPCLAVWSISSVRSGVLGLRRRNPEGSRISHREPDSLCDAGSGSFRVVPSKELTVFNYCYLKGLRTHLSSPEPAEGLWWCKSRNANNSIHQTG